jgi:riboflavin synthase
MFTGLVREVGTVESFADGRLVVRCSTRASIGDSVSLDGVCLTVVDGDAGTLSFDVVEETRARAKPFRERVNVEPALRAGEPLGGHYVQGHVDGVGTVAGVTSEGDGRRLTVDAPGELLRYCVEKGSVAVDGVSLTIAALTDNGFEIALVPHTLAVTTLSDRTPGDAVNLEIDVLAKYVERLLADTMRP